MYENFINFFEIGKMVLKNASIIDCINFLKENWSGIE